MSISGIKGMIDIENNLFDQTYGTLCLEENRSNSNIKKCQQSIQHLKQMLSCLNNSLNAIKHDS